jgi:heat shock protein HslJ
MTRRAPPQVAALGLALAAALMKVQVTPVAEAATLDEAPWRLVSYVDPEGRPYPVLPGTEVTATFQGGRVSGSAGCNQYTAGYQLAQDTAGVIRLTQAASTMRFCTEPPGVMEQEAAYLAALERVGRYTLAGEELTLREAGGGALLVFRPQPQRPLAGPLWEAEDYNNGRGGLQSLAAGTEITARFEGGRVAGSAGCNTYTAGFSLAGAGGAITVSPPASTRRRCAGPPGIMEQEAAYLAALPTAARYRIEGDRLALETAAGARVATYRARAAGALPSAAGPAPGGPPRSGAGPTAGAEEATPEA